MAERCQPGGAGGSRAAFGGPPDALPALLGQFSASRRKPHAGGLCSPTVAARRSTTHLSSLAIRTSSFALRMSAVDRRSRWRILVPTPPCTGD
jgi:hypothetical protein